MNLHSVSTPPHFGYACLACEQRYDTGARAALADLDGPAFAAYVCASCAAEKYATSIRRTVVPEHRRLAFMPAHWGRGMLMLKIENRIYTYAGLAIPGYRGGIWDFIQCSNGAGYLRLSDDNPKGLVLWGGINEFCNVPATVSMDGAGLAITTVALNHELSRLDSGAMQDQLITEYEKLLDVARQHPDAESLSAIFD